MGELVFLAESQDEPGGFWSGIMISNARDIAIAAMQAALEDGAYRVRLTVSRLDKEGVDNV